MTFLRNTILIVFITVLAGSAAMAGISGTFVKADASNTGPADGINWNVSSNLDGYDGKWDMMPWGSNTALTSAACFAPGDPSYSGEDAPQITTTVNGLDPAKKYEIYVQFFACYGGNWAIYANLRRNT